jgi:BirA family biotin operon repressor/biotin-[acetyl-CoA-carboxylase] ligase
MSGMIFLDEVDSTNSYLKERINELPDGAAVTALMQTAGRGRRGHDWLADNGMLPLSILLKSPKYPTTITLSAGAAVCDSLAALSDDMPEIGIKWPNDIIIGGRKVCGILCESVCFGDRIDVICGIGVNLTQDGDYFEKAGIPHGGSIKMLTGITPDRNRLAEDIARRVYEYCANGFPAVYEMYRRRCLTLGKQVRIIESGGERTAFAKDIAQSGFLICEDESGTFEVNSGEVSVRGLMDYI